MTLIVRVMALAVVSMVLALAIGPASAQELPDGPTVAACLPGAGYASGCDVDQDGDVDIFDIQLTAGRWNTNGAYTSGHTHWGDTWTGATGDYGLRVEHTAGSGTTYGIYSQTSSSSGYGLYGYASATSGLNRGVAGRSDSSAGYGVIGYASATSGSNRGVYGRYASSAWTCAVDSNTATTVTRNGVTAFSDWAVGTETIPTAVTLADFSAVQQGDAVLLTWETVSELTNLGFNLYRGVSPAGPDRQLNPTLIPSQSPGNSSGFIYTWEDRAELMPGTAYFYWVEDVDIQGVATMHGPVSVVFSVPTSLTLAEVEASPAAGSSLSLTGAMLALLALLGAVWRARAAMAGILAADALLAE